MDGVASLVEVISNRYVVPVFKVGKVFFEAGVKGVSSFTMMLMMWCLMSSDVGLTYIRDKL